MQEKITLPEFLNLVKDIERPSEMGCQVARDKNTEYTSDEQNRKKLIEAWTTSNNRMQTIKEVRALSGFGLLRTKYFLENTNDQEEFIKTGKFILLP